jgi:manganese/zinc/iron transport system permease protein
MLMCISSALVGVIVYLKKQSLIGEALSHATYPGVVIGVMIAGALEIEASDDIAITLLIITGACITALLGLWCIHLMQHRLKVYSDSAMCFILASFFGIGLTLASHVQFAFSSVYRQAQIYLYGQAATMTDVDIGIYTCLFALVVGVITLFYKEIYTMAFDRDYAKSLGINTRLVDNIVYLLIVIAVVTGIRSVGVVLMSAMLIAPAVAARQYTHKLSIAFLIASFFGAISGFLGNYLSIAIGNHLSILYPTKRVALATGPMIVIVASTICILSLLFAPERGLAIRYFRIALFRHHCLRENLLKSFWRYPEKTDVPFDEIAKYQSSSPTYLHIVLSMLSYQGWLQKGPLGYRLTPEGRLWSARIVRLHRLWEVYLVDYMGMGVERVHRSAEEIEHIITPELERELTILLRNPKRDPHHQPIPDEVKL